MRCARALASAIVVTGSARVMSAQRQVIPPTRELGTVVARAATTFGAISQAIVLGDGRVAVNDTRARQLVILDSALANPLVALDTTSGPQRAYGPFTGVALRYLRDTLLFAEASSQAFIVIDRAGAIAHTIAFPRAMPASVTSASVRMESNGMLVYARSGGICGEPGSIDSNAVQRVDLRVRHIDTVGFVRHDVCPRSAPSSGPGRGARAGGGGRGGPAAAPPPPLIAPVQSRDVWAVLSDGTIAIVRARDFTIEWLAPDGRRKTTPRLPHEWRHLTDADKQAIVDSMVVYFKAHPLEMSFADGRSSMVQPRITDPVTIPDYLPPLGGGARGDAEGNLWVQVVPEYLLTPPEAGTPLPPQIYDIVNRDGVLIDRVRIPAGRTIVGFGPGMVYLSERDGASASLLRVRIR